MNDFDLLPERAAGLRRVQTLARKINLLLDTNRAGSGQPLDYRAVRDAAQKGAGYYISRTRWPLLKSGKEQVVPEGHCALWRLFSMWILSICSRRTGDCPIQWAFTAQSMVVDIRRSISARRCPDRGYRPRRGRSAEPTTSGECFQAQHRK